MKVNELPINRIRDEFMGACKRGRVVLTASTGSGKSTQVPRWLSATGKVLVVEPRRVAARSLATWVSHLEQTELGQRVGYAVRDEERRSDATEILFVTPGVALRLLAQTNGIDTFESIVLDEFHERSWQLDLLLAILRNRRDKLLIVMSATIDVNRIGRYLNCELIRAEGRSFPVEVVYDGVEGLKPTEHHLSARVCQVVQDVATDGDVLVFLPGIREIREIHRALNTVESLDFEICQLHGQMSLGEQNKVFGPTHGRKLILTTNIAETSLTLPNVRTVIDSGLVRRTQYFHGRSFLGLLSIAEDSAEQRRGRAGRVAPGRCIRLWSHSAKLEPNTQPEVLRESLSPLLLSAATCGYRVSELEFLTPLKPYAVDDAHGDLGALGVFTDEYQLTEIGRELAQFPPDPHLARLAVEGRRMKVLAQTIWVLALLNLRRRPQLVFHRHPIDENVFEGCDVWLALNAYWKTSDIVEMTVTDRTLLTKEVKRLARVLDVVPATSFSPKDRECVARVAIRADRRFVFLKRTRRRSVYWTNGNVEASLAKRSALAQCMERDARAPDALVALSLFGLSQTARNRSISMSWVMPLKLSQITDQVETQSKLVKVAIDQQEGLLACYAEVHATKTMNERWTAVSPQELLEAFIFGLKHDFVWSAARKRVALELSLYARARFLFGGSSESHYRDISTYATYWFDEIGVETSEDFCLLDEDDFYRELISRQERDEVLRRLPDQIMLGTKPANVVYDLEHRTAELLMDKKNVKLQHDHRFLPRVEGFRIVVLDGSRKRLLRA